MVGHNRETAFDCHWTNGKTFKIKFCISFTTFHLNQATLDFKNESQELQENLKMSYNTNLQIHVHNTDWSIKDLWALEDTGGRLMHHQEFKTCPG